MSRARPGVVGVQRHVLDEAQPVAVAQRPGEQGGRLVEVRVAHQHGVDLHRVQAGGGGGGDAGQHVVEPVAPGQRGEALAVEGVERDVDPVEAGRGQVARPTGRA